MTPTAVPSYQRSTMAAANRARKPTGDPHEDAPSNTTASGTNSQPSVYTHAASQFQPLQGDLFRAPATVSRSFSRPNVTERIPAVLGRWTSSHYGDDALNDDFVDSPQAPERRLDISDDEDEPSELPTTITTCPPARKVAFAPPTTAQQGRQFLELQTVRYPSLSKHLHQARADDDTDLGAEAWASPAPSRSLSPSTGRINFENQPSTTFVVPQDNDPATYDIWETNQDGIASKKEEVNITALEDLSASNKLVSLYSNIVTQVRDMWRDLLHERQRYDRACDQLLNQSRVIHELRDTAQDTQEGLEGYKGDLADAQSRYEVLKDELRVVKEQLSAADAQVTRLTEQLRDVQGTAHTNYQNYQQVCEEVKQLAVSKASYKARYREEFEAHQLTQATINSLQVRLRKAEAAAKPAKRTRAGPTPPHYSDSEPDDEEDFNPYRRSRSPARRARSRSRSAEDDRRRPRPKKPEPEVFSGKDTSHADYLKWKMDVLDWFNDYARDYSTEAQKLSYIRQKTKEKAFGCIQHGFLDPGVEFVHSDEAWSILDSVFKTINTMIEAQAFYESNKSYMKHSESMGEYIARFNVGTSALRWADALKIQFMRNRLPTWFRDQTAMKVIEPNLTFLDFCNILRHLEQANPTRPTAGGGRSGGGGGGGNNGGNKNTSSNNTSSSGSGAGPRGRTDLQVKVLRHMNRCFNCTRKNHSYKATGGYCSGQAPSLFNTFPEVQDALEKAIANGGKPIGDPARPKTPQGAAIGVNAVNALETPPQSPEN
jgi:archaellum component FlaC